MPKHLILYLLTLAVTFVSNAQFNENLEKEILDLSAKYKLDGFDKSGALDLLEDISPDLDSEVVSANLIGQPWKYSHTVSTKGRKYRQSNAIYSYDFRDSGEADFKQKDGSSTYCTWENERSKMLEIDRYESSSREKRTRRDYFGIHMITEDRLVLTKIIKSPNYSGRSAIVFLVYFRK